MSTRKINEIAEAVSSAAPQPQAQAGEAFPIGSVFIAVVSTNPATLLGYGSWSAFGAGRVMVGRDSGDVDFDVAEETGGAKTVASSAQTFTGAALSTHQHDAVSAGTVDAHAAHTHSTPAHTHSLSAHTHSTPNHSHSLSAHTHEGAAHTHNLGAHTHAYTDVPNHVHTLATGTGSTGNFSQVLGTVDTSAGGTGATPTQTALGTLSGNPTAGVASGTTGAPSSNTSGARSATTSGTPSTDSTNSAGAGTSGAPSTDSTDSSGGGTSGNPSASLTHAALATHQHAAISAGTPAGTNTPGAATSVVQPYVVVYFWKRTA